jgi:ribosome-associated protein
MKSDNSTVSKSIHIDPNEIFFKAVRASGPGGQNVNKTNTKVILFWNVTESKSISEEIKQRFMSKFARSINEEGFFLLTSSESRSQAQNLKICQDKLIKAISSVMLPRKIRKKSKPSRATKEKRLRSKKLQSEKKRMRRAED